jgi:TolB-like protein/DNA-binding winged helix-turn-helix (wHTH) protein/Tfp pilus assembly protein PilF
MDTDAEVDSGPVRFGESFELDIGRRQLRRYGQLVRLERIPLEILILLVQKRGEIVPREEIVARVWGGGVYLDTDNAINGSIRKIRQILKDNPEEPKYIQTITGKGYRFVADAQASVTLQSSETDQVPVREPGSRSRTRSRWILLVSAVAVAVVGIALYLSFARKANRAKAPEGKYMLAVLPFENLTGDPGQEYFSDGLTEEMISQLGNLDPDHLGVIARTSVMQYKNNKDGLSKVGRELGVHYALEGSVRREAGKVRIAVQLIQMKDQTEIWARQYDRDLGSLLNLENEIANQVAQEIRFTLEGNRKPTEEPDSRMLTPQQYAAYDSYLRGRYFWNKRTAEGFQQAIKAFDDAIDKDPNYARAYVGLADTYALQSAYDLAPKNEAIPKARAAAAKALALNDSLAEAHASMAIIAQNYDWDWQKAETEYKKAISLDPNYPTARHWYAEFLTLQGRFSQALEEIERARQLDPRSLIIAADRGATLYCDHRYDEAIQQLEAVLEMEPDFPRAYIIVFAYVEQGRTQDALRDIAKHQKLQDGPFTWMLYAYAHGRAGHQVEARTYLHKIEAERSWQHVDTAPLVMAHLGMGEKEQALNWLEKGLSQRSNSLVWLKVDPVYDPLRSEPRFHALLKQVGFE